MYYFLNQVLKLIKPSRIMSFSTNSFKLFQYDAIGLDLDNTLVRYKLGNLFQLHYKFLTKYLVENKNYHGLSTSMNSSDIDFIRKGLFIDINRGNILDVSSSGSILQASHGTKKLSENEIIRYYGPEKSWSPSLSFLKDTEAYIQGVAIEGTYSFLDFTDSTTIIVYAKSIDLMDENGSVDYKSVWDNVIEALIDMYKLDSEFISTAGKHLSEYVYKCSSQVIEWLQNVRKYCKLMLITSATPDTSNLLAKYTLGPNWESLFDIIIDTAKKPAFFIGKNPFRDRNNQQIELNTLRGYYRNGNWQDLHKILTEELGRPAKCVYIGDNIIQDIYSAKIASPTVDTIALVEEALTEDYFPGDHPHVEFIKSKFWGSYFGNDSNKTLMYDLIMKHSILCIPSLEHLAANPIDG